MLHEGSPGRSLSPLSALLLLAAVVCFGLPPLGGQGGVATAQAQQQPMRIGVPGATERDGLGYVVSSFEIQYTRTIAGLPDPEVVAREFGDLEVTLARVANGFVAPRVGVQAERIAIRTIIEEAPTTIYGTALKILARDLMLRFESSDELKKQKVFVTPSPDDIDPINGWDRRGRERDFKLLLLVTYEGPSFPVSRFEVTYAVPEHPDLPPPEDVIANVQVMLTETPAGYFAPRPDAPANPVALADMRMADFSAGALQEVLDAVFGYFADRQFMAVRVVIPQPPDVEAELNVAAGTDLRQGGRTTLRLRVITGLVTNLRTLASGDRIPLVDRVDNEKQDWIREESPFQPYREGDPERRDVLKKDELDDYLFRLSRHPGRRVDASIAPAEQEYGINLDYLVTENKSWLVYAQVSNTGTEQTDEWRERVGFFSNQFTGNDDILSVDFITSSFDETNAVFGEYNAPVLDSDVLRWRTYGSWGDYTAADVGFAAERFEGESWQIGGALVWNVYQYRQLFLDLFAGARYTDIEVDNKVVDITGDQDFFLPHVGAHLQRYTEEASSDLVVSLEWQTGNVTGVSEAELNRLGRLFPDEDWAVLRWDAVQSFYLEPLLNRAGWEDVTTPASSTLAHEIYLRFRGQYAFDYRLIPQEEMVAGGLYSVRGYEQSVTAGDTVLLGTVEYRFHVPRAFGFQPEPATFLDEPFRVVPQFPYGRADWDLILRGFLDIGRTINSDKLSFERDDTLVGMGVGLELQYRTNLNVRMDWGFALESVENEVSSGSSQFYIVATLMF